MSIVSMVKSDASDASIAGAVIENVPKGTYLTIQVFTSTYDFPILGKKKCRIILLKPTGYYIDTLMLKLQKMFIGLPRSAYTFNGNIISRHILGIECTSQSELEIRNACSEKRQIRVYISTDCKALFADIEMAEGICNIL